MHKPKAITRPQMAAYWRAASAAAREIGEPVDAYRKRIMKELCGVDSVKKLNRTTDYDAVMRRFAADAGDYAAAARYAVSDSRRMAFLVRACARQVLQLNGCHAGDAGAARNYLAGVVGRSRLLCGGDPRSLSFGLDMDPCGLRAVFCMLDVHRRRLLRRICPTGSDAFFGFDPAATYAPKDGGGVVITYDRRRDME